MSVPRPHQRRAWQPLLSWRRASCAECPASCRESHSPRSARTTAVRGLRSLRADVGWEARGPSPPRRLRTAFGCALAVPASSPRVASPPRCERRCLVKLPAALQLTLWPAASHDHASHTPSQAHARGERTSGTCGPSSHEWCEKFDPDGCWLRTFLASALQQRTRCSLIWTRRATPAGRSWWVLTTLERPIAGSASGSWPTAKASDEKDGRRGADLRHGRQLAEEARRTWATASARDWRSGLASEETHARNARPLNEQVTRLSCEAGPPDPESSSGSGRPRDSWATPDASGQNWSHRTEHRKLPLHRQVGAARGSLNPDWVASLMGVPDGWLGGCDVPSSKPLETESSPRSSRKSAAPSSRRKRA